MAETAGPIRVSSVGELTRSCQVRPRRRPLPWPMRVRCRSTFALGNRHTPAAGGACPGSPLRERLGGRVSRAASFRASDSAARRCASEPRGFEGARIDPNVSCTTPPPAPTVAHASPVPAFPCDAWCIAPPGGRQRCTPGAGEGPARARGHCARDSTLLPRRVSRAASFERTIGLTLARAISRSPLRDRPRWRRSGTDRGHGRHLEHLVASPLTAAPTAHTHVRGFFASGEEQMAKQLRRTPWNGFLGIHGCGTPGSQDVS